MARKTNTDPFDFSKAKNSIPFRTPMAGGVSRSVMRHADAYRNAAQWGNLDSEGRIIYRNAVSPWKALAIYAASLTRLGANPGMTAAFTIAKNAPRGATALKLGASMVRGSIAEAETILQYKPSTMFTRGIGASPELTSAYYRSLAKILGQQLPRFPAAVRPTIGAAGQVLKNASRGLVK